MSSEIKDDVVLQFVGRVRRLIGNNLLNIYWFGSRSRMAADDDSDYDFMIETARALTDKERDMIVDTTVDISGEHRVLLDVHYVTHEKLDPTGGFMTPLRQVVLTEGIAL